MTTPRKQRRERPSERRSSLRKLWADPAYIAFKASLGEPLAPAERALLDAARSVSDPLPVAGGRADQ